MGLEPTTLSLGIPPSDCAQPCPSGAKREVGKALRVIDPCPHGPPWGCSCRWNGMKNGLYAASCSVVPKHRYGLRRRDWSGFDGFEAYV